MVGHDIMILAVLHDAGSHELWGCEVRPDIDDLSIQPLAQPFFTLVPSSQPFGSIPDGLLSKTRWDSRSTMDCCLEFNPSDGMPDDFLGQVVIGRIRPGIVGPQFPSLSWLQPKFCHNIIKHGHLRTDQCCKGGISGRVPLIAAKRAISPYIKQDRVEFLFRKSNRIGSKHWGFCMANWDYHRVPMQDKSDKPAIFAGATLHYTTLHYTPLHYTTLHYTTLPSTTLHYITIHYTPQHYNYDYTTTLHSTTLNYTTLHYITLHYTPLDYTALHYTTLHDLPLHFTTLHYTTLHYTTTTATATTTLHHTPLHKITLHYYITLHSTTPTTLHCRTPTISDSPSRIRISEIPGSHCGLPSTEGFPLD